MTTNSRVWISVSDMMTGLMMVFLFIAIVFMEQVSEKNKAVENIAFTYKSHRDELYNSLQKEFEADLSRWNAEVLKDSTVRFNEPDVLFDQGSKEIKNKFKTVLNEFFPRYVSLLASDKYRTYIEEVRIEGHTSSSWEGSKDLEDRYLNNALLSQQRSFTILEYCFSLTQIKPLQQWLTTVLRANGLAFAMPILIDGKEDESRSRRVEFKVKTKADEKIHEIIDTMSK
jgi:chemotaxis protein MotB